MRPYKVFLTLLIFAVAQSGFAVSTQPEESFHTITVRVPVGNLREKPSVDARIIYKLTQGTRVAPRLMQGEWLVVQLENNLVGWAHQSLFLKPDGASGAEKLGNRLDSEPAKNLQVRADVGRVRSRPSLDGPIRSSLYRDETVAVITSQNGWHLIQKKDHTTGWAHQSLFIGSSNEKAVLRPLPDAPPEKNPTKRAALMVASGRVREHPSLEAKIKFGLVKGQTVSVLDTQGDWWFIVTDDGRTGWTHQSLYDASRIPPVADQTGQKILKDIDVVITPEGKEMVSFWLSGPYPPDIFSLTDKTPAVVCDFPDATLAPEIERSIPVKGRFIQSVRFGIHKGTGPKIRAIIDLVPENRYEIRPVFFKDDNLFTVIVLQEK